MNKEMGAMKMVQIWRDRTKDMAQMKKTKIMMKIRRRSNIKPFGTTSVLGGLKTYTGNCIVG